MNPGEQFFESATQWYSSFSGDNGVKPQRIGVGSCPNSTPPAPKLVSVPKIEKVIFNPPCTIVKWVDGDKTIVKTDENDVFNEEVGLAMAVVKKLYKTRSAFQKLVASADRQLPKEVKKVKKAK